MKIVVLEEKFQRKGNSIVVVLNAEVRSNDPRELPLVEGVITATGMSSCCPEDTFDELTGKRIARSRAYKSLYQIVKRAYYEELESLLSRLKISQDCIEKYERAINAQTRDIERLTGEEEVCG